MTNTQKIKSNKVQWLSCGKSAPETSKNKLVESLLDICETIPNLNNWITRETFNAMNIFQIFINIKKIHQSISIYYNIKNNYINEIIISSSPYTKEIYDRIVEIFMDFEDETGREYNYYYVDSQKIPDSLIKDFSVYS